MLSDRGRSVSEERSTTKAPLADSDVRELLARAKRVVIARGQKADERAATEVDLSDLKGRSGKYRAPILLDGDTLLVGFNAAVAEEL